jgi:NAD+ kinase
LHPALTVSTKTFMNTDGTKEVQPVVCHVLNEISVTRGSAEFMMLIDVYVNDVHLTTVQGDGVLISTPTGSTAYNMSCGGSIVHASAQVICVTPICPHSLSFRPLILPIDAKITLVLPSETRTDAWVTFDG